MESNINLSKNIYEAKKARDILDEEFKEFLPKQRSIKEFFDIYNNKFYSILNSTHAYLVEKSLEYIITWTNPLHTVIENIKLEISNTQVEIDSVEKFHPLLPNRIVISPSQNTNFEELENDEIYYMMSGKARPIEGLVKENLHGLIKARHRSQHLTNEEFIVYVDYSILEYIEKGKTIRTEADLADSFYDINTYNGQEQEQL
jgi:hypothetical protein